MMPNLSMTPIALVLIWIAIVAVAGFVLTIAVGIGMTFCEWMMEKLKRNASRSKRNLD